MSEEHNHFGECPECGKGDEYRNIYKQHFFFCDEHRFVWSPGANLLSSWREEDEWGWRAAWEKLKGYRTVDGFGEYQPGASLEEQVTFEELVPKRADELEEFLGDSTPVRTPVLAIKINNTASNDPCALCGARTDPECGPELFLAESWALVCYPCGEHHAPELMRCLEGYREGLSLDEYLGDSPSSVGRVSEDVDPF